MSESMFRASWRGRQAALLASVGFVTVVLLDRRVLSAVAVVGLVLIWVVMLWRLVFAVELSRDDLAVRTLLRTKRLALDEVTVVSRALGVVRQRGKPWFWSIPGGPDRQRFFEALDALRGSSTGTTWSAGAGG